MGFLSKLFGRSDTSRDDPFRHIDYEVPPGWSGEILEDAPGILLLAPDIEGNWQSNIFVEVRSDPVQRDLADSLDDLVEALKCQKPRFQLAKKEVLQNRNGTQFGRIEYKTESEGMALTEWEVVIPSVKERCFFLLASAATACWAKYESVFHGFVESLMVRSEGN